MSLPKRSAPYRSNPPFLIFWHLGTLLSPRVPECQKIKKMAGSTSMAVNALVYSFLLQLEKNMELKGLNAEMNKTTIREFKQINKNINTVYAKKPRCSLVIGYSIRTNSRNSLCLYCLSVLRTYKHKLFECRKTQKPLAAVASPGFGARGTNRAVETETPRRRWVNNGERVSAARPSRIQGHVVSCL